MGVIDRARELMKRNDKCIRAVEKVLEEARKYAKQMESNQSKLDKILDRVSDHIEQTKTIISYLQRKKGNMMCAVHLYPPSKCLHRTQDTEVGEENLFTTDTMKAFAFLWEKGHESVIYVDDSFL